MSLVTTTRDRGATALGELVPLTGASSDFDPLFDRIGDASLVLLGEASHGTHDFYRLRADLTQRLIEEKGFAAVAIEGDWPDAARVNRWVRGRGEDRDANGALGGFKRFPQWMWRNADVLDFVGWLREHNDGAPDAQVGFYGLDLYSLFTSIDAVIGWLEKNDPAAARRARERYACFDHFGHEPERYGEATAFGFERGCEDVVVAQLLELQRMAAAVRPGDDAESRFDAEQNARLVRDAERYYRTMFHGRVESWNERDRHMAATLEALRAHLSARDVAPKVVVWAHNSHLGDARATEVHRFGELNLGQLVRERHGSDAVLVGFTTHHGTVTAASEWGGPAERRRVREALPGSHEAFFHGARVPRFLLLLDGAGEADARLAQPRLERAIGVIYRPETERGSHYFEASLARQFDAVIHVDATRALVPLERTAEWDRGHPDTFPTGI